MYNLLDHPVRIPCFLIPCSWQFNSTNEFRDVSEENVIVDGAVSVVSYVPRDESDYGTLLCWGRNELGRQRRPCVFHVIPAGEHEGSNEICIRLIYRNS